MRQSKVLLGVTGSIAAYKAAELVRLMVKKDWAVSVIMTESAELFVGELTFRTLSMRPVVVDMFEKTGTWEPSHIALADWADAFLIAPCTANVMAKLANGISDDALTATALACEAPLLLAPAMNDKMWRHPATVENRKVLKSRGCKLIEVGSGELACGRSGEGRMAQLDTIMAALERALDEASRER